MKIIHYAHISKWLDIKLENIVSSPIVTIILFIGVIILFFFGLHFAHDSFFKLDESNDWDFYVILEVILALSSFILLLITLVKLKQIISNQHTDYLISLDERQTSKEIVSARMVIHNLSLESRREICKELQCNNDDIDQDSGKIKILRDRIGRKIIELRDDETGCATPEFIYLLNLLDFLETIGFLFENKKIDTDEIKELFGDSILFFYEIFEEYIKKRRTKNKSSYSSFEKLYLAIRLEKSIP